jgi:hypothetical protein
MKVLRTWPENAETIWKTSLKIYLFELKILGYPEIPLRRLGNV